LNQRTGLLSIFHFIQQFPAAQNGRENGG